VSSLPTPAHNDLPPLERPLSALPPRGARVAAFSSIVFGGIAGGLIGYALVDLQCSGACDVPKGIGVFSGAKVTAAGMGVVAVLVLRALGVWKELQDNQ
jgi:hypothetical protein